MPRNKTPLWCVAQAAWAVALLSLGTSACTPPVMEGYQLQAPPEGFLYFRATDESHHLLPGREIVDQGVWYGDVKSDEPRSSIMITEVAEVLSAEDVRKVWQSRVDRFAGSPYRIISPVFEVRIDERAALAWTAERHDQYERFLSMTYRAFVPYDSATYFIEYEAGVPERMNETHLAAVVGSFGLGRTTVHWYAIYGAAAAGVVLLLLFIRRLRPHHTTAYRLPKVPGRDTSSSPDDLPPPPATP